MTQFDFAQRVQQQLTPLFPVTHDVAGLRTLIVNLYFIGDGDDWLLVDAGLPKSAALIRASARERFDNPRPRAIILTHGHFDHTGSIRELADEWDVPVYTHELELPYLTGRSQYPPPDPTVGGGMMARMSLIYPRGPIDLSPHMQALPMDGSIPFMPGWKWIHTPGHTPGHVSLWRESDRTLIAGDAF